MPERASAEVIDSIDGINHWPVPMIRKNGGFKMPLPAARLRVRAVRIVEIVRGQRISESAGRASDMNLHTVLKREVPSPRRGAILKLMTRSRRGLGHAAAELAGIDLWCGARPKWIRPGNGTICALTASPIPLIGIFATAVESEWNVGRTMGKQGVAVQARTGTCSRLSEIEGNEKWRRGGEAEGGHRGLTCTELMGNLRELVRI
ncbi:hypothetical protein C8J57DRAFT_1236456 [Mycena rebaudengoi]|nr:hypothetical protein C8J57DRAFT_1236456 [Mycena rebaudengoi]